MPKDLEWNAQGENDATRGSVRSLEIKQAVTNKRAVILMLVFWFIFSVFTIRILYIQFFKEVHGEDLRALAEAKYQEARILPGKRGTIHTRDGGVIAEEVPSYAITAILSQAQGPNHYVKDVAETAKKLSEVTEMEEAFLRERLEDGVRRSKYQIELGKEARGLTYEQKEEIESLRLPGIVIEEETRRYYAKGVFASHVIGHESRQEEIPSLGLEAKFDDVLQAKDGKIDHQLARGGRGIPDAKERIELPENGSDLYTTIDTGIQVTLEQAMTHVEEVYTPEKMTAIVANPHTGEILAMSNRPSFDPNAYHDIENFSNYAVHDTVEPGSTMKAFTVAAAIEEGVFHDEEMFRSGQYEIDAHTAPIRDVNRGGWGDISFAEGVYRSSNVLMTKLVLERLGLDTFSSYWQRFGFNEQTGIDMAQEGTSRLTLESRADAARTSFGQSSAMTPIQIVQAFTAIANEGKMMKPYVVQKVVDESGKTTYERKPEVVREVISAETAAHVRKLLRGVVSEPVGTGQVYDVEGLQVAGKTGTAQIVEDGKYLQGSGQYLYSFLGMAPYDDPQVVVYVSVTKPNLEAGGGGVAPVSYIFNEVIKSAVAHTTAEENKQEEVSSESLLSLRDVKGKPIDEAVSMLKEDGLTPVVIGEGSKVVSQSPQVGEHVARHERMILRTDGEETSMPDMTGWSVRDVLKVTTVLSLEPSFEGHGYLVKQHLKDGVLYATFAPRVEQQDDNN